MVNFHQLSEGQEFTCADWINRKMQVKLEKMYTASSLNLAPISNYFIWYINICFLKVRKNPTSLLNKRLDVYFTRKSQSILSKDIIMSVFCWHTLSQCYSNYIYLNFSLTIILVNPKQKDYVVICYFTVLYSKFIMTYFQMKVTNCNNFIIKKLYIKKCPYNWDFIDKIQPELSYL